MTETVVKLIHPLIKGEKPIFIPVDEWCAIKEYDPIKKEEVIVDHILAEEDKIFRHTVGAILLPVSQFYGITDSTVLDYFVLTPKRCYNSKDVRDHCTHYLNYFEKFYDKDRELLAVYYHLKYLIDYEKDYNKAALIYDLKKYILDGSILYKARRMNRDNYALVLKYRNVKTPGLQYTDKHGRILMEISLLMNMIIPLLTHFIHVNKIQTVTDFLLEIFDNLLHMHEDVDIYNKLYETATSNINRSRDGNPILYNMQNIRGRNATTHSVDSVNNIIVNIMPKYTYNANIVIFNYRSILKTIGYVLVPRLIVI